MPRTLFKVWHFQGGPLRVREVPMQSEPIDTGARLLSWTLGPGAAVQLIVNVPAGAALTLRGFTGPAGTGHAVDEETVTGPATNRSVVLFGSPVASVLLFGTGTISSTRVLPIDTFINDPGWTLVETVGLPANDAFASTGYPLDPQGPVGGELPPVDAAIRRVKRGTPDASWNALTDRGTAVPAFVAPDPSQLVTKELRPLVDTVARLLEQVADPAKHAEASYPITVRAPRSVHGVAASAHWQSKAHDSELFPLGNMLIAAGTDSFSALALGFGTTLSAPASTPPEGTLYAAAEVRFLHGHRGSQGDREVSVRRRGHRVRHRRRARHAVHGASANRCAGAGVARRGAVAARPATPHRSTGRDRRPLARGAGRVLGSSGGDRRFHTETHRVCRRARLRSCRDGDASRTAHVGRLDTLRGG